MVMLNIEKPRYCIDCPCHNSENYICKLLHRYTYDSVPEDCPIQLLNHTELEYEVSIAGEKADKFYNRQDVLAYVEQEIMKCEDLARSRSAADVTVTDIKIFVSANKG